MPVPADISIRDAHVSDLGRLHEIDALCFDSDIAFTRAELLFHLRHGRSCAKAAVRGEAIVGFAIGRVEGAFHGHVITIDVLPEVRRAGIGTALLEILHDEFRRAGVYLSVLEVDVHNAAALRFYEKMRYERVETLRGYYRGRSDAYRMVRFL